jgi:DNA processing protein
VELDSPSYVDRETIMSLRPAAAGVRFAGLYVAGSLECLSAPSVAVVGARAPSDAGRSLARMLARALARAGVCVISGLALGIDGAAHQGALDAKAPTIGILGGGHRRFHPHRHRALAEAMAAHGGAIASPFPPDMPARPAQFIQRNALIASLAHAVVVVEAAQRSGSLNTAGWAADLGIPVFAFPGDVDRPKVAGCLALIRDGATLARNADDILEGIGLPAAGKNVKSEKQSEDRTLSLLEGQILARLRESEAALDELGEARLGDVSTISASLVRLELQGLVERRDGGRFGAVR